MISNTSFRVAISLILAFLSLGGCASSVGQVGAISVEGEVWARGNAPFSVYVLTTDQQNHYVLDLSEMGEASIRTPARLRVHGYVYVDQWNGIPFAHLRVDSLEELDE